MLKIKDNVDLKELEKFGLQKNDYAYKNHLIMIFLKTRHICSNYISISNEDLSYNIIFDLIQAGLVEKVGE